MQVVCVGRKEGRKKGRRGGRKEEKCTVKQRAAACALRKGSRGRRAASRALTMVDEAVVQQVRRRRQKVDLWRRKVGRPSEHKPQQVRVTPTRSSGRGKSRRNTTGIRVHNCRDGQKRDAMRVCGEIECAWEEGGGRGAGEPSVCPMAVVRKKTRRCTIRPECSCESRQCNTTPQCVCVCVCVCVCGCVTTDPGPGLTTTMVSVCNPKP